MHRRPALALDVLPAIAFASFLVVSTILDANESDAGGPDALGQVLIVLAGLSFGAYRRAPLAGFVAALTFTVLYLTGNQGGPIYIAPVVTLLPVVAARPPSVWVPALIVSGVALTIAGGHEDGWGVELVGAAAVWLAPPLIFAGFLRARRDQAVIAEAESRGRVADERLRMARDLHDVVGHSLSTISLHAGVAERALDTRPEQVRDSLQAIRQASGDALDELRAVLGILRGDDAASVTPTPGLDALPALVDTMRDAGLDVRFEEQRADGGRVPDVVGAAAFRIVQESLTNVVRHAGPSPHASVRVLGGHNGIQVEVSDDGPGPVPGWRRGTGITGMQERAAAVGGELDAGPVNGRGFRVRARLPVRRG